MARPRESKSAALITGYHNGPFYEIQSRACTFTRIISTNDKLSITPEECRYQFSRMGNVKKMQKKKKNEILNIIFNNNY